MAKLNELISARKDAFVMTEEDPRPRFVDYERLPSYVFPVDYAFGGGLPFNLISQFYGPPMGGKSTLALLFARGLRGTCISCVKPLHYCKCEEPVRSRTVWCSTEGPPDRYWFDVLGVHVGEDVVVAAPEYGEDACEIIEAAVQAEDCGLVVLDSLAGLVPRKELERSYADLSVGEQARLVARLVGRARLLLTKEYRKGHRVAVLFINQIRSKIGGMTYGSNETTPGGYASKHGYRLSARINQLSAKDDTDKKSLMASALRFSVSLIGESSKQQLLTLAGKAEYKLGITNEDGYRLGVPFDWPVVLRTARDLGVVRQEGSKYILGVKQYSTLKQLASEIDFNQEKANAFRWSVVQKAKEDFIARLEQGVLTRYSLESVPEGDV